MRKTVSRLESALKKTGTMDWEKEICELIDAVLDQKTRTGQLRAVEEVINSVEDLVFAAFYRGAQSTFVVEEEMETEVPKRKRSPAKKARKTRNDVN